MKRHIRLSTLCLCIGIMGFSQEQTPVENDLVLSWSEHRKLEWTDYQGQLDPELFGYALTSYKIDFIPEQVLVDELDRIQGYENLTVEANFYKWASWTISSDPELLKHEQLHFDIAELFARKIRKRFVELKGFKEKRFAVYSNAYDRLWKACRTLQMEYDRKTGHGVNLEMNKEWAERIRAELYSMKAFR